MAVRAHSYAEALRIARAAGTDAGNRAASREGRATWSAVDWNAAAAATERVMEALGHGVPPDPFAVPAKRR